MSTAAQNFCANFFVVLLQNGGLCRLDGYDCACNSDNSDYVCRRGDACPCDCTGKCAECFPSAAKVKLENGNFVTMAELQIGDKIQTGMVHWRDFLKNLIFFNKSQVLPCN